MRSCLRAGMWATALPRPQVLHVRPEGSLRSSAFTRRRTPQPHPASLTQPPVCLAAPLPTCSCPFPLPPLLLPSLLPPPPPSSSAHTLYFQMAGPKPTANRATRMPCSRAAAKWPASCTATMAASTPTAWTTEAGWEMSTPRPGEGRGGGGGGVFEEESGGGQNCGAGVAMQVMRT